MLRGTFLAIGCLLTSVQSAHAQDALASQKIDGLRGVRSAALVFRMNDKTSIDVKSLSDVIIAELAKSIPAFKMTDAPEHSPNWVEISIIGSGAATVVKVSVYRWVTLLGTKTDFIATTWENLRLRVGGLDSTQEAAKDLLHDLLTSFAADYIRANQ